MVEFTVQQPIIVGTILNRPLVTVTGALPIGSIESLGTIENAPLITVQGTVEVASVSAVVDVATINAIVSLATVETVISITEPVLVGTIENAPLVTVSGSVSIINFPRQPDTSGAVQSFDVAVSTLSAGLNADTSLIYSVTVLADAGNTATLYVGSATQQSFPLKAGASITMALVQPSGIYLVSSATQQVAHIIYGGD